MIAAFRIFLVWLCIFTLGFVVYSTSQGRINAAKDIQKAARWYPTYSEVLLNLNDRFLASDPENTDIESIRNRSIGALTKAPLSFKPFLQLAEASISQKSLSESRVLFLETHKRNIRNRRALRSLVNIDAALEDYSGAIDNLSILLSLNAAQAQHQEYHDVMLLLSDNEVARKRINEILVDRPVWGNKYLKNRIGKMTATNSSDIGLAVQNFTQSETKASDTELNGLYLDALYKMGDINQAYQYWKALENKTETRSDFTIFNPTFDQRKELPPFNWRIVDGSKYFSEIDQGGGLYASYADRSSRLMTEQVLMLDQGSTYRFSVDAEWSYRQRQGMFFWSLNCIGSENVIAELHLDDDAKEASGGEIIFTVPSSGCEAQRLSLLARPGQYSQRIWSLTHSLRLNQEK